MSAYVIINAGFMDPEVAAAYVPLAQSSMRAHEGRYLVAAPTPTPTEGVWESPQIIVVEFPSRQLAEEWYDSEEYRQARDVRAGKVRVDIIIADALAA